MRRNCCVFQGCVVETPSHMWQRPHNTYWSGSMPQSCAWAVLATSLVAGGAHAAAVPSALSKAIAVRLHARDVPAYQYALEDLDGDGIADAVALIADNEYCGSGGCNMCVLKGTNSGFVDVSGSTVTRQPILVLAESKGGWRSISVFVSGGGARPGQVVVRFNRGKYPSNPAIQPRASAMDLRL